MNAPQSPNKKSVDQLTALTPVFAKGHLMVTLSQGEQAPTLHFPNQNISLFGVRGLSWGALDPAEWFGKHVRVQGRMLAGAGLAFDTDAVILRESTEKSEQFGLKFFLSDETKIRLQSHLTRHGKSPVAYVRKYPRIPLDESITTFPTHVAIKREGKYQSFVMNIRNLSPNGMLLSSENPMALRITPGEQLDMVIDPRGWFPFQIKMRVLVCRITDEWIGQNRNIARMIGIRFLRLEESDRQSYLELLRDILSQLQAKLR